MKLLILNTYYHESLCWIYVQHPGLEQQPYKGQAEMQVETLFEVVDRK